MDWLSSLNWRLVLKFLVFAALLYLANYLTHHLAEALQFELRPNNEDVVHRAIMTSALLYAGLLALPFVPGAEIGIALLVTLGPPIAFLVYICTVVGLFCSFVAGRFLPIRVMVGIADSLKQKKLSNLLKEIAPLDQQERITLLATKSPSQVLPIFLRYRYLGLAVLFNIPGNFLIGGGGGIGLVAGMSGLFSIPGYLFTIMIAVSPIPLAVSLFGSGFLK